MASRGGVFGGFVHIVESPSAKELLDGRTEGRVLGEALALAGIPHCYSLVTNTVTLREALHDRLVVAWRAHGEPPILHRSLHGNSKGVALTDDTFITWEDLGAELTPPMKAMEGGLLTCMSSCFGSSGCRMAMHTRKDKVFWALVGNRARLSLRDSAVAYVTFYHLFFKGLSLEECVTRMRLASANADFLFLFGEAVKSDWAKAVGRATVDRLLAAIKAPRATPPGSAEDGGPHR